MKIIKHKKEYKYRSSVLMPIIYLLLGFILAFKSNIAITLIFNIIGLLLIFYGIKNIINYYQNNFRFYLNSGIASIIFGLLIIILAEAIELSIRYILGFFLIYIGISKLLTQITFNNYKNFSTISNIILIVLGMYSIFVSNALLVIIGYILIINSFILFWESLKNKRN